jgi:protein-tyrosine phosphatase
VITTDSAGTHAYHIGNPPDPHAQATALHHNIDLSDLITRKVTVQNFYDFEHIVAIDRDNKLNLNAMNNNEAKASVHLFMEFAENWSNDEVPDPYYSDRSNDINGFEQVF